MAQATFRKLLSDKPFTRKIPRLIFRFVTAAKTTLRNRKANPDLATASDCAIRNALHQNKALECRA
jgi:hypothetical protein